MPATEQHAVFFGSPYGMENGTSLKDSYGRHVRRFMLWGNVPVVSNEIVSMTMDSPHPAYWSGSSANFGSLTSDIFNEPFGRNLRLVSVRVLNGQNSTSIIEYNAVHDCPAPGLTAEGQSGSKLKITGLCGLETIFAVTSSDVVAVTFAYPNAKESVQQPLLCNSYSNNDVVFIFPKSSRAAPHLWARIEDLTAVSAYWQTMFEAGFSEANSALANVGEWQQKMRQDLKSILASHREPTSPSSKAKPETPLPTYRAILTWITHKDLNFAALRDQPADDSLSEVQPSALDVYKLAHQLQISDLMELSLGHYRTELNATNAFTQLFSTPAYLYPELRAAALKATVEHWASIKSKGGMAAVQKAITAGGDDVQVVGEIVVELMKKVSI